MATKFPFEFTVKGTPASQQCRRRNVLRQWRSTVLAAARRSNPDREPIVHEVLLSITYYYLDRGMDIDNLAKPICDALKSFVYDDDEQVSDLYVRKRNLNREIMTFDPSELLTQALQEGEEFVHVVVDRSTA